MNKKDTVITKKALNILSCNGGLSRDQRYSGSLLYNLTTCVIMLPQLAFLNSLYEKNVLVNNFTQEYIF